MDRFPVRELTGDVASHTSHRAYATRENLNVSVSDIADDGGTKPNQEVLRFVSPAPHSLPMVERFARGMSARTLPDGTASPESRYL